VEARTVITNQFAKCGTSSYVATDFPVDLTCVNHPAGRWELVPNSRTGSKLLFFPTLAMTRECDCPETDLVQRAGL
jgi:hypothetical protein